MHVAFDSSDMFSKLLSKAISARRPIRSFVAGNGNVFSDVPVSTVRINILDRSRIGVELIERLKSHLASPCSFTKEVILAAIFLIESEDSIPRQLVQNTSPPPWFSLSKVKFRNV